MLAQLTDITNLDNWTILMCSYLQESPIPGAVGSAEGPGWWKVLDEVFYTD
jgi:hypothetical protein